MVYCYLFDNIVIFPCRVVWQFNERSIIFASMYIGGGLAMRVVGRSVGSVAVSSGDALNELLSLISCSHCFFSGISVFLSLANGVTLCFLLEVATVQLSS